MERHIILAHKLIQLCIFRILPPLLPLRCVARSNRNISNRRIKPDIENLSTASKKKRVNLSNFEKNFEEASINSACLSTTNDLITKSLKWNWNPPLQIPGNTSWFQPFFKPVICYLNSILAPRSSHQHFVDVFFQFVLQQGEFKKQVVCLTNVWCRLTDLSAEKAHGSTIRNV